MSRSKEQQQVHCTPRNYKEPPQPSPSRPSPRSRPSPSQGSPHATMPGRDQHTPTLRQPQVRFASPEATLMSRPASHPPSSVSHPHSQSRQSPLQVAASSSPLHEGEYAISSPRKRSRNRSRERHHSGRHRHKHHHSNDVNSSGSHRWCSFTRIWNGWRYTDGSL